MNRSAFKHDYVAKILFTVNDTIVDLNNVEAARVFNYYSEWWLKKVNWLRLCCLIRLLHALQLQNSELS